VVANILLDSSTRSTSTDAIDAGGGGDVIKHPDAVLAGRERSFDTIACGML
jgi:hypothetical protein